jgi:hypothetical protein
MGNGKKKDVKQLQDAIHYLFQGVSIKLVEIIH